MFTIAWPRRASRKSPSARRDGKIDRWPWIGEIVGEYTLDEITSPAHAAMKICQKEVKT